jgi:SagB-type dehydrogenase family enzyme
MRQTIIKVPSPQLKGKVSLEETILKRRAVRRYRNEPLELSQLSQILWSAEGTTLRSDLARTALDQEFIIEAPVDIVICALHHRTFYRYGRRGERYFHIEVGHVGENIHLQAVALGLAIVEIGAFHDEKVRKVLGVDGQTEPLYIMPLGKAI